MTTGLRGVACGLTIAFLSGCNLNGHYGGGLGFSAADPAPVDLNGSLRSFLPREFPPGAKFERGVGNSSYVEYYVSNLRGEIVPSQGDCELLQLVFTSTASKGITVNADGWFTSGRNCPVDHTLYERSMTPQYADVLRQRAQQLANDLAEYASETGR